MSADKYQSIFSRQMKAIVYIDKRGYYIEYNMTIHLFKIKTLKI